MSVIGIGIGVAHGGAVSSFTPEDITTDWWLDAKDSSTITESGGNVSQWNDKSGNGYNVTQGTAGFQPKLSTLASGETAILFDGSDDNMASGTTFTSNSFDIFIVGAPQGAESLQTESSSGLNGLNLVEQVFYPISQGSGGDAGFGVSIGTNGVSCSEHASVCSST